MCQYIKIFEEMIVMVKKLSVLLCVLIGLYIFSAVAFAENAEWKSSSCDFKSIEKIYVEPDIVYGEEAKISDLDRLKVMEAIEENKKQTKKYRFVDNREIADAVVVVNISKWGTKQYWHEPETYTEYETITHKDKNGKTSTISIPVTKTKDGYYYSTEFFSAGYVMTDRDGQKIYERIDSREDEKKAASMFGRATKDFYKAIDKLK